MAVVSWEELNRPTGAPVESQVEATFLSAMLSAPTRVRPVLRISPLSDEDFGIPWHRHLYNAWTALGGMTSDPDTSTILHQMESNGCDGVKELPAAIGQIVEIWDGVGDIEKLRDILSQCNQRRSLTALGRKLQDQSIASGTAQGLIDDLSEVVSEIRDISKVGTHNLGQIITPEMWLEKRIEGLKDRLTASSWSTGSNSLDSLLTMRFAPGQVTVIAARPSIGKSTLKRFLIRSLCEQGAVVLSFVPEQGFDMEADNLDAPRTGLHLEEFINVRDWADDDPKWDKVRASSEFIMKNWKLYTVPGYKMGISEILSTISRVEDEAGQKVDVVFFDLFNKIREILEAGDTGHAAGQVTKCLGILNEEAKLRKFHYVPLVQIRRDTETRSGKQRRPILSDLKGSGSYEEDADTVLLLHREKVDQETISNNLEINIGKQRNGPAHVQCELIMKGETNILEDPTGSTIDEVF